MEFGGNAANERQVVVESMTPCDKTSYMYFSMAILLFTLGAVITFFSIEEPTFNVLDRIWYFGPLLITSGLMVAVKTLIYLKRKSLIAFITNQRLIIENGNCSNSNSISRELNRADSNSILPSYEDSILQYQQLQQIPQELPPPTYEEALFISLSKEEKEVSNGTSKLEE